SSDLIVHRKGYYEIHPSVLIRNRYNAVYLPHFKPVNGNLARGLNTFHIIIFCVENIIGGKEAFAFHKLKNQHKADNGKHSNKPCFYLFLKFHLNWYNLSLAKIGFFLHL